MGSSGGHTIQLRALEREAFEAFPYAMLVLDAQGRVLRANAEATRLIGGAAHGEAPATCCSLFGCGAPGSALAGTCVSRTLMDAARGAAAELRVDLTTSAGQVAVSLVAGRLASERVAVQIRPAGGLSGDAGLQPALGRKLYIRCLGATEVRSDGRELGGCWLDQRAGQLLKFLTVARRRPVTVDEIAESIWSDASYQASGSVRYYIHSLRSHIEPWRGRREASAFIRSRAGSYQLSPDSVTVDADVFERSLSAALLALVRAPAAPGGERRAAVVELERALNLYGGDFLAELPYADWALCERRRLHDLACSGLRTLADDRLQSGALDDALDALDRLAGLQPYDEDVQRELISLELRCGRRSGALRRYEALCARSRRVFGEAPSFALSELAAESVRVGA
jgi:DNA-binding SARP family transcriptional activator